MKIAFLGSDQKKDDENDYNHFIKLKVLKSGEEIKRELRTSHSNFKLKLNHHKIAFLGHDHDHDH